MKSLFMLVGLSLLLIASFASAQDIPRDKIPSLAGLTIKTVVDEPVLNADNRAITIHAVLYEGNIITMSLDGVMFYFDPNADDENIPGFVDSGFCPTDAGMPGHPVPSNIFIPFDQCPKETKL